MLLSCTSSTTRPTQTRAFKILMKRLRIQCVPGSPPPPQKELGMRLRYVHVVLCGIPMTYCYSYHYSPVGALPFQLLASV